MSSVLISVRLSSSAVSENRRAVRAVFRAAPNIVLGGARPNQLNRFSNLATQTMFAPCGEPGRPRWITIGCVLRGQL